LDSAAGGRVLLREVEERAADAAPARLLEDVEIVEEGERGRAIGRRAERQRKDADEAPALLGDDELESRRVAEGAHEEFRQALRSRRSFAEGGVDVPHEVAELRHVPLGREPDIHVTLMERPDQEFGDSTAESGALLD